jgi:hypothetical protein
VIRRNNTNAAIASDLDHYGYADLAALVRDADGSREALLLLRGAESTATNGHLRAVLADVLGRLNLKLVHRENNA